MSLKVPAGSKPSLGCVYVIPLFAPNTIRCRGVARWLEELPLTPRGATRWWVGYIPSWLPFSPLLSFHSGSRVVLWPQRKVELPRRSPVSSLGVPKTWQSGASNFFLLVPGNNNQAFQRERKKLTKVEEGIQWTRSSQWETAAGNWEPIRIHGRRELVLPSSAPRKLLNPLSDEPYRAQVSPVKWGDTKLF